jgi:L-alanine-DL-glutamate epimerase-like enolase superfamily enzyme
LIVQRPVPLPIGRRAFAGLAASVLAAAAEPWTAFVAAAPRLRVTGFELLPVRATERTVWLLVRLRTDAGLTGLGEASDAFGFMNTTNEQAARMESDLTSS